jgi:hypothetical protein
MAATHELIRTYLEGGGRIRKVPEALPITPQQVLQYLDTQQVVVRRVRPKSANSAPKYRYGEKLITWRDLVDLANRFRRKQRLAPFQLTEQRT